MLAHIAYALPHLTRQERADHAKVVINTHFNSRQRVFLDFVLSHYVNVGVDQLDADGDSIAAAVADLGPPRRDQPSVRRLPEVSETVV